MYEKNLGIGTLNNVYRMFLSAHGIKINLDSPSIRNYIWKNMNTQPERQIYSVIRLRETSLPKCQHYNPIRVCANLLGISSVEIARFEFFCGIFIRNITPDNSVGARAIGRMQTPFYCCERVRDLLGILIREVKGLKTEDAEYILRLWRSAIQEEFKGKETNFQPSQVIGYAEGMLKMLTNGVKIPCRQVPKFSFIQTELG